MSDAISQRLTTQAGIITLLTAAGTAFFAQFNLYEPLPTENAIFLSGFFGMVFIMLYTNRKLTLEAGNKAIADPLVFEQYLKRQEEITKANQQWFTDALATLEEKKTELEDTLNEALEAVEDD
jgi:hypothetical protein